MRGRHGFLSGPLPRALPGAGGAAALRPAPALNPILTLNWHCRAITAREETPAWPNANA